MNRLHVAVTAGLLIAPLQAQSPPAFEVVSVKPNRTGAAASEYGMKVENAGPRVVLRSTRGNMGRLAEILTGFVGNTVSNDTGLGGEYDFVLEWVQDPRADVPGPSLFTALREQVGLRLESSEKEMPVVVIDQIERPSEN